jgi:hypothetical protein
MHPFYASFRAEKLYTAWNDQTSSSVTIVIPQAAAKENSTP